MVEGFCFPLFYKDDAIAIIEWCREHTHLKFRVGAEMVERWSWPIFGTGLVTLSRWPISRVREIRLARDMIHLPGLLVSKIDDMFVINCHLLTCKTDFRIYHFFEYLVDKYERGYLLKKRLEGIRQLHDFVCSDTGSLVSTGVAPSKIIIAGDYNFLPDSQEMLLFKSLFYLCGASDGKNGDKNSDKNSDKISGKNEGGQKRKWVVRKLDGDLASTHPLDEGQIDYVIMCGFCVKEYFVINNTFGSDHYPVFARLA
jgi:endonuclease/exonuclease/phosphatase family metal-dependent hydrolase